MWVLEAQPEPGKPIEQRADNMGFLCMPKGIAALSHHLQLFFRKKKTKAISTPHFIKTQKRYTQSHISGFC